MIKYILVSILIIIVGIIAYRFLYLKETAINVGEANYLILYFAPWCGHCKAFKPIWENMKKMGLPVKMLEIDCGPQFLLLK